VRREHLCPFHEIIVLREGLHEGLLQCLQGIPRHSHWLEPHGRALLAVREVPKLGKDQLEGLRLGAQVGQSLQDLALELRERHKRVQHVDVGRPPVDLLVVDLTKRLDGALKLKRRDHADRALVIFGHSWRRGGRGTRVHDAEGGDEKEG